MALPRTFNTLYYINMTGATSGAGTAYPSVVHPWFLVGFVLLDL